MTTMNDERGHSMVQPMEERYEEFYSCTLRETRVQYDYRTLDGHLFSCIAKTLEDARARRDAWIAKHNEATHA
jgi:hypothetical protein